jgi:hypothetical protein
MSKAKIIDTRYIIELQYEDSEYHLTVSDDLKNIFEVDCLKGNHKHGITELLDVLWMLNGKNELFD